MAAHDHPTYTKRPNTPNSQASGLTPEGAHVLDTHTVQDMAGLASETTFRHLLEVAPDAVVMVDSAGTIMLVNLQTEQLFGYTREELLGQPVELLVPERFRAAHTGHRHFYAEAPRTRPMGIGLNLYGLRKDGCEFPVEISLSPVPGLLTTSDKRGDVISTIRDITPRKQLEERLRQAEQEAAQRAYQLEVVLQQAEARRALLQMVIDELPSAVYLVRGEEARLALANRAVATVWGAPWREGQTMRAFLEESGARVYSMDGRVLAPDELATLRAVRGGEPIHHHQEVIRHPDGTTLPILFNAVTLAPSQLTWLRTASNEEAVDIHVDIHQAYESGALVVLQDVTPLKEAEQLKDEFLGIVAHELRTPMAVIQGFAETLMRHTGNNEKAALSSWQVEALEEIAQATIRLNALMEDLLNVTRLQAGRLDLRIEPSDIVALARRVITRLRQTTERHTLRLHAPPEYIVVLMDAARTEQVMNNLITNAIKYSPTGGDIDITIRTDTESGMAEFSIHDRGIGIPVAQQGHIFGRFVRGKNADALGIRGTGLGLYLCRELVERENGRIWFESTEGQGTTFSVALPLAGE